MENKTPDILFLSSWYPSKNKPLSGIFVKRQAAALAKFCNVSVIYVSSGEKSELVESTEDGIYTVRGYFKKVKSIIPLFSQLQRVFRYRSAWRKAITLYLQNKGKPALIHSNIVFPVSVMSQKLSKKWNIPFIISEHWSGYFPQDGRYKGTFMQMFTKLAISKASAVITVSEALKKSMLNAGLANNYYVISNIVDTDTFNLPVTPVHKENFTFIHVSSLVEMEKNVSGIIHAFSNVHNDFPASKLIIVGDGDNKSSLESLTKKLGVIDAVSFTGVKKSVEVAELIRQANAFVLFSNFETQGVALLEALCCGIPGIATTVGGPADYINTANGILVNPGNETQLAQAMTDMIKNINTYNPLSIRNSVVDMVSEKNVAQKITDVYKSVLKK